jgi:hypothetical protein
MRYVNSPFHVLLEHITSRSVISQNSIAAGSEDSTELNGTVKFILILKLQKGEKYSNTCGSASGGRRLGYHRTSSYSAAV